MTREHAIFLIHRLSLSEQRRHIEAAMGWEYTRHPVFRSIACMTRYPWKGHTLPSHDVLGHTYGTMTLLPLPNGYKYVIGHLLYTNPYSRTPDGHWTPREIRQIGDYHVYLEDMTALEAPDRFHHRLATGKAYIAPRHFLPLRESLTVYRIPGGVDPYYWHLLHQRSCGRIIRTVYSC